MARFYFDIRLGECLIRDDGGTELVDQHEALAFALDEVEELLMTQAGSKITLPEARIDVCDDRRRLLFSVPFQEALAPRAARGVAGGRPAPELTSGPPA
ncbi:MAG TPA: hypothetical protein VHN20_14625 [Beijerinckiaceae bacterium]|nr:hypothetical protein [Beijerinckiaceae bacterium]